MQKQVLLNSIVKEMKIVRRLSTKIPANQSDFRPKDNVRSTTELLQYLSNCGTGMIRYWYRKNDTDFRTFYAALNEPGKTITVDTFAAAMDTQIELINKLFEEITEDDLVNKIVDYPWGEKAPLGEAILETCIKWMTGYKMQLFLKLKLSSDENLTTPDLWRKTELDLI
jgi:hypothetical protein